MASARSDLLVVGATGFTGRLVLEYLAKNAPKDLSIELGARNLKKLEEVQRELGTSYPAFELDADDNAALDRAAEKTRTVCTTVGPYAKHGQKLVAACARNGAHYCDITGEVTFIRRSIDENHVAAQASGAKIVHCCGFDSVPSDLGVWMVATEAKKRHGQELGRTQFFVGPMRGGVSGGTVASMLELMNEARHDRSTRSLLGDPYALSPDRKADLNLDGPDPRGVRTVPELQRKVAGPFVMAACNTRVVRRSNALLDFAYGRGFRYSEEQIFGRGAAGFAAAYALVAGLSVLLVSQTNDATARAMAALLPKSGTGPDKAARESGFFKATIVAETADGQHRLFAKVGADGDPGYAATARMLGESALTLACDPLEKNGGVLTPATALGDSLLRRLRLAGMTFEVE